MNGKKCLLYIIGFLCFSYNLFGYTLDNPSDTIITETDISDGILIIQNNNQPNITITLPADITLTTLQIYGNNIGSCIIQIQGNTVINSLILGFDLSQSAANVTFSSTTSENLSIGTLDTTYNSWNASDEKSITIDSNITATINTWNLHDTPGMGNSTPVSFTNNGTTSINNIVINDDSSNVTISGTENISVTGEVQGNNAEDFISQVSAIVDIPSSYTELTYKNGDWFYVTPTEDFARTPNANTKKLIINENASLDISTLTALEEILINNGAIFDILTNSINTSVLNTASNGTIKTTGTVTVTSDTTYISSNLSIQANVISLQNSNLTINKVTVANASFTGDCIVNAETEISSGINAISSPNITFKKSVVFSGMSPMVEDISSLIFEKNVTAVNDIAFSGIQNLVINFPSKITAGNNLTFRDNNNISGTFETGTGTIKFGDYNGTETTTISEDTTLNGDVTNADTIKINSGKKLNLTKNFDDSIGTVTGDATGTGIIYFTGSENQTFTPNTSTTYKNIVVDKTGGTLTVDSALKIENFTITKATQTTFNDTVNITNFTDTANAGDIEFTDDVKITSATTMQTSGTVILANGKTLEISDGALPPTFYNFTHIAGNTELNGEITAANISLGQIKVPSSIATNTANVTLTSSTGNFTLGTIGEESKTFADVTLNAGSNEITLNGNQIYSSEVDINTTNEISLTNVQTFGKLNLFTNNDITLSRVKVSGIVDFNTTAKVTLTGGNNNATALSVDSLNFTSTPSEISLSGQITSTGANGFILPNITTTLAGNTTLTTTNGPITLYDNINAANRDLTIINAGTFTLNDTENPTNDPLTMTDTPISQMQLRNFTQDGNGSVILSGDINTTGTVTFTKAITLADNVSISSTQDISIKESISRTTSEELKFTITDTTKSVIFSGTGASINVPITVNGNLQNIGAVNYNVALTVTGNVTNAGTWNGTGNVDINGNVTNSNSSAWNGTGDITLTGNFTDNGTWTGTGDITLSGTANQTFIAGKTGTNPTTYTKIIVDKTTSGKASFNTNALNVTEIDIQGNADFNSAVNINTLTNTFTSGDILFAAGGVIKSDTTFATTGEVNFSGTAGTQFIFADGGTNVNFTHTAGQTNIDGVEITALTLSLGLSNIENSTITGDINTNDIITITNSNQTGDFTNNDNATISDFTLTGDFTNNATVSVSNFTQTGDFNNSASATFTISDDSTLNGNLTNYATATFEITANKTFYLSKNFTNNGTFTAGNNSTFALIDKTNNTTIQGTSPTFYHFKAINKDGNGLGGKTLTLNTDITVTHDLILKGTSNESLLTIKDDGSGKGFLLSASQPANAANEASTAVGNYLHIGPTVKIKNANIGDDYGTTDGLEGIIYKSANSKPTGTYSPGTADEDIAIAKVILNGWRIKNLSELNYTWTGLDTTDSTDWGKKDNWLIGIVPGKTHTKNVKVIIPDDMDNYPILQNTSYTIRALTIGGTQTTSKPASITLRGTVNLQLTGTTNPLTNNRKIIYENIGHIVNSTNVAINDSAHGTVEYAENSSPTPLEIADVEYNNLLFSNGNWESPFGKLITCNSLNVENTPSITIKNGLTVKNSSINIPTGVNLFVAGTIRNGIGANHPYSQNYNIPLTLIGNSTFICGTNDVTFFNSVDSDVSSSYSMTVGENANKTNLICKDTIGATNKISSLQVYGNATFDGEIICGDSIAVTKNAIFNNSVTSGTSITISENATFNDIVTAGTTIAVTGNATFNDTVTAGTTITVTGTSNINCSSIISGDNQTYTGATNINADVEFKSQAGKVINFIGNVKGSTLASGRKPNIKITTADAKFDTTVTDINDITILANATFDGAVSCDGAISVTKNAIFNNSVTSGTSITIFENATFNDIVTAGTTIAITGNSTFNGIVTAGTTITVTGTSNINCSSIISGDNQTYTGATNINADVEFKSQAGKLINFIGNVKGTTLASGRKPNIKITTADAKFDTTVTDINDITILANATFDGAVTCDGSIAITGNSTFNDTVTVGTKIEITGDSTFKETVSCGGAIVINGNTTFDGTVLCDDAIEINGNSIFNDTVTVGTAITITGDTTFNKLVSTGTAITISGITTFNDLVTAGSTITLTGTTNINCASIISTDNQTYNGAVILFKDTSLIAGTKTITINATVNSDSTGPFALVIGQQTPLIQTNLETTNNGVIGAIHPLSKLTVYGTSKIAANITTSDNQTYTGATNINADVEFKSQAGKLINFIGNVKGSTLASGRKPNIKITTADAKFDTTVTDINDITILANATFDGAVTCDGSIEITGNSTFNDNVSCDGAITVSGNATFNGIVTSGTTIAITGNTNISSTSITSKKTQTYIGELTITSPSIAMTSTDADFISNIINAQNTNVTLRASNITFNNDSDFTNGTLKIQNKNLFTLVQDKILTCKELTQEAGQITQLSPEDGNASLIPSSNSKNMIEGNINATTKMSFQTELYILGISDSTLKGQLLCTNNLILAKNSNIQKITLDLSSTQISTVKNVVLYSGELQINGDLASTEDVILFGANYNSTDHISGVQNAYLYETQRFSGDDEKPGAKNFYTLETHFPKSNGTPGNIIPQNQGSITIASGKNLTVGKNFYANGLSIKGDIKIPDNTDSSSTFAEAYNCEISDSKVTCTTANEGGQSQIACENCTFVGDVANIQNYDSEDLMIQEAYTVRDNVVFVKFNRAIRNKNNEIQKVLENNFITLSGPNAGYKYIGVYQDRDCQKELLNKNAISFYLKVEEDGIWNTDATGLSSGNEKSTDRNGIHRSQKPFLDIVRNSINASENPSSPQTENFPWLITDIFGKRLINYSTKTPIPSNPNENVEDHTGPVLYQVRTGQENHIKKTGKEDIQHSYDAHNFIEFRYSEPVNFGATGDISSPIRTISDTTNIYDNTNTSPSNSDFWLSALSTDEISNENIRVNQIFGAIKENIKTENSITLTNLAKLEYGKIHTGSKGNDDKFVNSLYRIDSFTIRYSIAGFTDGTIKDQNDNEYKNWIGYIENAKIPSGKVTIVTNETKQDEALNSVEYNMMITDCATSLDGTTALFNKQERYKNDVVTNENLTIVPIINSTPNGIYGTWDLSEPVFAPLRLRAREEWSKSSPEQVSWYESVGNTNGGGSTLQKIEFHLFDNTPDYYNDDFAWLTKKGWVKSIVNSTDLYINNHDENDSYCADIFGGSRPFESTNRTTGGIRFSSIEKVQTAFMYTPHQDEDAKPDTPFADNETSIYPGAKGSLFTGSSAERRSADILDGLYFGIQLSNTTLPLNTLFTISYDDKKGFITDLAGNRLRSATIRTMDRTPPSYDFTLSPVNQDEISIVFVKDLRTDSQDLDYIDENGDKKQIFETYEQLIPKCFELFTMNELGEATTNASNKIQIDYSTPAQIEQIQSSLNKQIFTNIKLRLTKNITLKDLEETYIRVIIPQGYTESQDPITGLNNSKVTFIQDTIGNYMPDLQAHTLSDFAVSSMNPLYAYDQDMEYKNQQIMDGLYQEGSWAVHNWDANQQNFGTLPANQPIGLVADILKGSDSTSTINDTTKTKSVRLFLSNSQPSNTISKQINQDLNQNYRIWLPEIPNSDNEFPFMAPQNVPTDYYSSVDSTILDKNKSKYRLLFNIPQSITQKWGANQQISFLFGFLDEAGELVRIYNAPFYDVSKKRYNLSLSSYVPLYALRLTNPLDFTSLDLWSYKTKNLIEQRGGVTVLNNVINVTNGEKVAIKVNMPSEGKLNVIVMTIDGNIITYLHHGTTTAGEHYYSWNGKNQNENAVARGLYFIRIVGNGIDETRKVMVVK